jgi:hypothetical protein
VQTEPITTSGTLMIIVGRRPVFLHTQLSSHSGDLSTTAPGPAAWTVADLEEMSQLLGAEKAELSQDATTVWEPDSDMPLADVMLTLSAPPAPQVTSAEPELTKLVLLQVLPDWPLAQAWGVGWGGWEGQAWEEGGHSAVNSKKFFTNSFCKRQILLTGRG